MTENKDNIWYAVRTYHQKESEIAEFLKAKDIQHFIPMIYTEKGKEGEKPRRILVPVVHNLLFIRKFATIPDMKRMLAECVIPMSIMKKTNSTEWCPISDKEMYEFRLICDPEYKGTLYVTEEEANVKVGKPIRVVTGPFKGMEGKLARFGNQYFVVKTLAGLGVLLHIPRWYCQVVEEK